MPTPETGSHDGVGVRYTYCHLLHAGTVDHELGWVARELAAWGAHLRYFLSDPDPDFYPHYTHGLSDLFRFGGCIPSIQVKADLVDTMLLGLQSFWEGGGLLVRAGDAIRSVADLAGRRVGLSRSRNATKVDYRRVTEEHGIGLVLARHGMDASDVRVVDRPYADDWYEGPGTAAPMPDLFDFWRTYGVPADLLQQPLRPDLEAGLIDACFVTDPLGSGYADAETVRLVAGLSYTSGVDLHVGGSPYALTCTRRFADDHPELVTAYLRGLVRAGRWANTHPAESASLLEATGFFPPAAAMLRAAAPVDFVPNLSSANLAAVEAKKAWMLDRGYVRHDLDVARWAAPEFLAAALRDLDDA